MPWWIAWRQDLSAKTPAPTGRPPALGFSHRTAPLTAPKAPDRSARTANSPPAARAPIEPFQAAPYSLFGHGPARQELQVQPIYNVTSTSPAHCGQQGALAREIRAWHLWAVD